MKSTVISLVWRRSQSFYLRHEPNRRAPSVCAKAVREHRFSILFRKG